MHQFSGLEKMEMQDKFASIHSDLAWRQDNAIWIVREQKEAHFPAKRGRTTMIENKGHLVVVGIMIGSLTQKVPQAAALTGDKVL